MISTPVSYLAASMNAGVVLLCIAFFAWRGYRRGVLRTLQRLLSILAAYMACYFFTETLANFFKTAFALNVVLSYLASAALLLVGVSFIVNLLLSLLITQLETNQADDKKLEYDPDADEESPRHPAGLAVGVLLGSFFGLFTVWLAGITLDAMTLNSQGAAALVARTPDPLRKMAGAMVGGAVGYAVEYKTGEQSLAPNVAAHLIADPVVTSQMIADVSRSEELKQFFSDPSVRVLMQENKVDELQSHPTFQKLMSSAQTRSFLEILGSTVKDSSGPSADARAAQLLTEMYQKARRVKSDPRFMALSQKPEFQQLLRNPSPAELLTNPLVKELGDIVFSDTDTGQLQGRDLVIAEGREQNFEAVAKPQWETVQTAEPEPGTVAADDELPPTEEGNVIYRWTDEYGQKHFSQTKPTGDYPLEVIKSQ